MDNERKPDLFDRMMHLPGLVHFEPFFSKHREIILYLFFGGAAFVISIGSFALLETGLGMNELLANIISWVLAVSFAFCTNRVWVFDSKTDSAGALLAQMASFFGGRVLTLAVEELIILVFITWLGFNSVAVKVAAQIIVIVLNYVISKLWVFRKK